MLCRWEQGGLLACPSAFLPCVSCSLAMPGPGERGASPKCWHPFPLASYLQSGFLGDQGSTSVAPGIWLAALDQPVLGPFLKGTGQGLLLTRLSSDRPVGLGPHTAADSWSLVPNQLWGGTVLSSKRVCYDRTFFRNCEALIGWWFSAPFLLSSHPFENLMMAVLWTPAALPTPPVHTSNTVHVIQGLVEPKFESLLHTV